jgi:hypothetical protein
MLHDHSAVDPAAVDRALKRAIRARLEAAYEDRAPDARCALCGCTDNRACPGGCWWVPDPAGQMRDVCSSCEADAAALAQCDEEIAAIEADPVKNVGAMIGWLDWHAEKFTIARRLFRRHREARRKRIRASRRRQRGRR